MTDKPRTISIVNYDEFQCYESVSGERPKWFKMYVDILQSNTWLSGNDHNRALMTALLCLAARHKNKIPLDENMIRKFSGVDEMPARTGEVCRFGDPIDLQFFFDTGFICHTEDMPEEEIEEEKPKKRGGKMKAEDFRTKNAGKMKRFAEFYAVYPRKEARIDGERAWVDQGCDKIADQIIDHLKERLSQGWKREEIADKKFRVIKLPATYLNGRMWEDELESTTSRTASRESTAVRNADGSLKDF